MLMKLSTTLNRRKSIKRMHNSASLNFLYKSFRKGGEKKRKKINSPTYLNNIYTYEQVIHTLCKFYFEFIYFCI